MPLCVGCHGHYASELRHTISERVSPSCRNFDVSLTLHRQFRGYCEQVVPSVLSQKRP